MIAPARRAAVDALAQIDEGHLDMGAAIARVRATLRDHRDGALLLELVTGTLRMRAAIDYQLAKRITRPLLGTSPSLCPGDDRRAQPRPSEVALHGRIGTSHR